MKPLLVLLGFLASATAVEWAVIVAGSNTYSNYRHQSDACHAYQIARQNGIPDSRIIMMYYDDIANNIANPYRGQIFNKPTASSVPGYNVYAGCKKDYVGLNVTAAKFLAVITGDAVTAGGPVLKSGPSDHVFINFVDHGGTGIIAFPTGPYLTSTQLNAALQTMYTNQLYGQLTFYMEACESGSMFEGQLPPNLNIYVTTASNAVESSWATYCPPDDYVQGKELGSCLGDLYSVNWMEDCEAPGHMSESLQAQFTIVQQETTLSHVMQYGDLSFVSEPVSAFLGDNSSVSIAREPAALPVKGGRSSSVRSRDVPMHLAYYRYLRAYDQPLEVRMQLLQELQAELEHRVHSEHFFMKLAKQLGDESLFASRSTAPCSACCGLVMEAYYAKCGGFSDYSLEFSHVLSNACKAGLSAETIIKAFSSIC